MSGKSLDELGVAARHDGRGAEQQGAGGAGGHQGGLDADQLGDAFADLVLQVEQVDEVPGRVGPGGDDLRRHQRAAEERHGADGVDDVLDAERFIDAAHSRRRRSSRAGLAGC